MTTTEHPRDAGVQPGVRREDRLVRPAGDHFCVTSLNVATASGERAARQVTPVREGAGG